MGLLFFMNDRKDSVLEKVFKNKGKTMDARIHSQQQSYKQVSEQKEHPSDLKNSKKPFH